MNNLWTATKPPRLGTHVPTLVLATNAYHCARCNLPLDTVDGRTVAMTGPVGARCTGQYTADERDALEDLGIEL